MAVCTSRLAWTGDPKFLILLGEEGTVTDVSGGTTDPDCDGCAGQGAPVGAMSSGEPRLVVIR